jgi:hypothetical protein
VKYCEDWKAFLELDVVWCAVHKWILKRKGRCCYVLQIFGSVLHTTVWSGCPSWTSICNSVWKDIIV